MSGLSRVTGRDRRLIRDYLRAHPVRRLQVGAGGNSRSGWLNTDWHLFQPFGANAIFLEASAPFPFPADTFDYLFSEHMIEHVTYLAGQSMLRECFRILKPGGKIRLATPDLSFLVALLGPELTPLQQAYIQWSTDSFLTKGVPATAVAVVNNFVRDWGHVFIYDRATLTESLEKVGFVEIAAFNVGESDDPELAGIDNEARMPDGFLQLESMTFQARKPG